MMANKFPGYNCQQCNYKTCNDLLKATKRNPEFEKKCPFVKSTTTIVKTDNRGIIDNLPYDFILAPLPGDTSCRERLLPLTPKGIKVGDFIKYRPIGCPVTHFAEILEYKEGLITIQLVGPRLKKKYKEIGLCMVIGFEALVEGEIPKVCQTVTFMPKGCMMRAVHSGKVIHVEGRRIKIEGIDLKVWKHER